MGELLEFPKRNKGRVRKCTGWNAAGFLALYHFECDDTNVERYDQREVEEVTNETMAMMLSTAIFATLTSEQKEGIRSALETCAYHGGRHRAPAAALLNILGRSKAQ